jgi:hypothetical protein
MRFTFTGLLALSLLFATERAAPASAQSATEVPQPTTEDGPPVAAGVITAEPESPGRDALAYNAEILDELLTRSSAQTIREEKFAAAAGITGGMILLGLSAWRLIEDDPRSQYSRGLGVMFMTLGMADLTLGVFTATRVPHEKHRIERWERAREEGITDIELAHFEGELQAAHENRQGERLLVRWGGLTHALAGALVLAFAPIPDSMSGSDRVSAYVIGGVFFAIGMGTFAASFRSTPSEKAWNEYNTRKMPMPGHEFQWGLAPSISRQGAGISFGGTF